MTMTEKKIHAPSFRPPISPYFVFSQAIGGYEHHNGEYWNANKWTLSRLTGGIGAEDNSGADLQVFICKGTINDRTAGIAWIGTVCSRTELNTGINEKQRNVLLTSEVRTYK